MYGQDAPFALHSSAGAAPARGQGNTDGGADPLRCVVCRRPFAFADGEVAVVLRHVAYGFDFAHDGACLAAARERKGVDLVRAERDTKIRVRYLSALERGDWRDLPGAVYTKGFLRNYALYLGLDPEDVLSQWRTERGEAMTPAPTISIPRPLTAPRRGLTFSPGILVAEAQAVALQPAAVDVDVLTFEKLVAEGTAEAFERAATLYQGELLEGLSVDEPPFEEWLLAERERLRELAQELDALKLDAVLASGELPAQAMLEARSSIPIVMVT